MAASVKHTFVNPIADDPAFIGTKPSDWNAEHDVTGLQEELVSGTNIKTVNNTTLLGSGNLAVGDVINPMNAAGSIIIGGDTPAGVPVQLPAGADGTVLTMVTGLPSWETPTGGHVIQDEGTPVTQRANLNFVGTAVTVTDDGTNDATVVTIDAGGGAVDSVNGQTGTVTLDAQDVQAVPLSNRIRPVCNVDNVWTPYTITSTDRWLYVELLNLVADHDQIIIDVADLQNGVQVWIGNQGGLILDIVEASGGTINGLTTFPIATGTWVQVVNVGGNLFVVASNVIDYVYGDFADAPSDGKQYAREDGTWTEVTSTGGGTWGSITGTLSDQTDLQTALDDKLDITAIKIPFVLSAGSTSYIPITSDSKIPFTLSGGSASNIPLAA